MCVFLLILKTSMMYGININYLPTDVFVHILEFCDQKPMNRVSETSKTHYNFIINNFKNASILSHSHLLHLCSNPTNVSHLNCQQIKSFVTLIESSFSQTEPSKFTMRCLETCLHSKNTFIFNQAIMAIVSKQQQMLSNAMKYHMYDFAKYLMKHQICIESDLITVAMELMDNPSFNDIVLWKLLISMIDFKHYFTYQLSVYYFNGQCLKLLPLIKKGIVTNRIKMAEIVVEQFYFLRPKRFDIYNQRIMVLLELIQWHIFELQHTSFLFIYYLHTFQYSKAQRYLEMEKFALDFLEIKHPIASQDIKQQNMFLFYKCELISIEVLYHDFISNRLIFSYKMSLISLFINHSFDKVVTDNDRNSIKEIVRHYFIVNKRYDSLKILNNLCKTNDVCGCCNVM